MRTARVGPRDSVWRRSDNGTPSSMRSRLRAATAPAHERMHAHPGFAAAAAGAIGIADYRRLIARVYGFHLPFEAAAREAAASSGFDFDVERRTRSPALLADLKALGVEAETIARLPLCGPGIFLRQRKRPSGRVLRAGGFDFGRRPNCTNVARSGRRRRGRWKALLSWPGRSAEHNVEGFPRTAGGPVRRF